MAAPLPCARGAGNFPRPQSTIFRPEAVPYHMAGWWRMVRDCPPTKIRQAAMYTASTRSITVTVQPSYLEEESTPAENEFRWAYHVRIENHGAGTVKLLSRYWRITDALGRVQ